MMKRMFLVLGLIAGLVGCGGAPEDEAVATSEDALSAYRINLFFSDESMTQQVGERSSLCTSTVNWGVRTQWVSTISDSCNEEGGSGFEWNCTCCWDNNFNGTCDGSEW